MVKEGDNLGISSNAAYRREWRKKQRKEQHKQRKEKRKLKAIVLAKELAIVIPCSAVLSWYISSALSLSIKSDKKVLSPFAFFKYYKYGLYKFPSTLFLVQFLAFAVLIFIVIAKIKKNRKYFDSERKIQLSKSGMYGTAKMLDEMGMSDFARICTVEEATGPILGQLDQTAKKVIEVKNNTRINRHCLVFGASQSGKTFSFVLPFALQAARRMESLIVTDPKGELYEQTSDYFRDLGYVVRRLDLKSLIRSDGWDCMKEITNSEDMMPENRADIFADIVIKNTQSPLSTGEGIYNDGPKLLLKALLLRVALDPDYILNGQNHINTLIEHLKNPAGSAHINDNLFDPALVPPEARASLTTYNGFKQASENLYGNIITGLAARLGPLDSDVAQKIMGTDEIDLTLPGKQPCVYYLIMSDQHQTYSFLSALFFSFLFLDLVEFADAQPNKKCPVTVNFLLDEFANIGTIPNFDREMAVIRSRGVNISIICQDINQLRNAYPKTYQSIMSNAATHICIGFNDQETEEYYSARSGKITTVATTEQHNPIELLRLNRYSTGSGQRELLASDELGRLSLDQELIAWQSKNVFICYKFPVSSHPDYPKLKFRPERDYPSITDTEAKQKLWAEEAARIASVRNDTAEECDIDDLIADEQEYDPAQEDAADEFNIDFSGFPEINNQHIIHIKKE